jgi:hypothetical protein
VFFLCLVHQARKGVFLWAGASVLAWAGNRALAARGGGLAPAMKKEARPSSRWQALFLVVFACFFFVYFIYALAPEISPDGAGYHLGNVLRFWKAHGFRWDYHSLYSYLSQGLEMLFLVAYSFGGFPAAAMVHLAFQAALPLLIVAYGRRFGCPRVAVFAAILVYASPVAGIDGASAYNDVAVATLIFAVFYLLQVWDESRQSNLLLLSGLFCGFAYGMKYTAGTAVAFAAGFVLLRPGRFAERLHRVALIALASAILAGPWMLRNWIWLGNPFAPFLNAWFPNPWYHPGVERSYLEGLRHYPEVKHYWEIPWQVIVSGGLVPGMLGPAFLLAPLALAALRSRQGRRLLVAAGVFALPALLNTETRFWIPVLPFVGLAIGLAISNHGSLMAAVALLHAISCWPPVLTRYCNRYAWCIRSIPVQTALRREPEQEYIVRHIQEYALQPALERAAPANGKVFSFAGRPEAYLNRDIIVSYESAFGNMAQDVLTAAIDHKPARRHRFRFPPVRAKGIRVVETASADVYWSIAEMRVFSKGRELPRTPEWRLSAWPNGWEVQLAFDNSYATRWSTWEAMPRGARVEIGFGRIQDIDEVVLEGTSVREAQVHVEVLPERGSWVPLAIGAESETFDPPPGIRRAATLELKARGIGWLLIDDSDLVAKDIKKYPSFWALTELARAGGVSLYRID